MDLVEAVEAKSVQAAHPHKAVKVDRHKARHHQDKASPVNPDSHRKVPRKVDFEATRVVPIAVKKWTRS